MNPSMMPTRHFRYVPDWARKEAAGLVGSMADSDLAESLKCDIADALRAERKASVDLLRSIAAAQLDDGTKKIVEACANAIANR